ncbi:hypothetical protein TNCV_2774851 [Trichonephila clavipes]|nr:hypothetical protein TNCV_2774851 [Trichonephila clavipes]
MVFTTVTSRSALFPLYSENRILLMAFSFSGTARSHKKPSSAMIMSSRSCATSRQSYSLSPTDAWGKFRSRSADYHTKLHVQIYTVLYLFSNLSHG